MSTEPAYIATITPRPEDQWCWDVEVTAGERVIFWGKNIGIGSALSEATRAIVGDTVKRKPRAWYPSSYPGSEDAREGDDWGGSAL